MQHLRFDDHGDETSLTVRRRDGRHEVVRDGEAVAVEVISAAAGEVDFLLAGRRRRAWVARHRDVFHVFLDGRVVTLHLCGEDGPAADSADEAGGPRVLAPMPGKIVAVLVEPGRDVERGDPLLLLEAMKMETGINAPLAGRVAAVHAVAGRTVGLGDLLVEIEPRAE